MRKKHAKVSSVSFLKVNSVGVNTLWFYLDSNIETIERSLNEFFCFTFLFLLAILRLKCQWFRSSKSEQQLAFL